MKNESKSKASKPPKGKASKPPKGKKKGSGSNIDQAFFAFQCEAIILPRNGKGVSPSGKEYRYVTLDDLVNGVRPFLMKHGLAFTQLVQNDKLDTVLIHAASGTRLPPSQIHIGAPSQMQDYGSRITYARRYALTALLGLSAEEDTDAAPGGNLAQIGKVMAEVVKNPHMPEEVRIGEKPVDKVEMPEPKMPKSESFMKAKGMIDSAYSSDALAVIKGNVDRSGKLTEADKVELYAMIEARETEVEGTVRRD